eukprot:Protomagalhaensia_wolfi_Nauph_80__1426@NODE_1856_length_1305_cov_10_073460_g1449_i0_p1_GENE_NODE_1856_length_1305_cov_10_073460_g1449_i0NODE_1856_length_1305_cov_10_073460_g1449_i0_p1_ORF_typecomplete_len242_score45_84_NODE_1856_length_1305_cov_10_073460_g1449_i03621087
MIEDPKTFAEWVEWLDGGFDELGASMRQWSEEARRWASRMWQWVGSLWRWADGRRRGMVDLSCVLAGKTLDGIGAFCQHLWSVVRMIIGKIENWASRCLKRLMKLGDRAADKMVDFLIYVIETVFGALSRWIQRMNDAVVADLERKKREGYVITKMKRTRRFLGFFLGEEFRRMCELDELNEDPVSSLDELYPAEDFRPRNVDRSGMPSSPTPQKLPDYKKITERRRRKLNRVMQEGIRAR